MLVGADDTEIFDIVFAVNEACSNAIEHPVDVRGMAIGLEAELVDERVVVIISDRGRWKAESTSQNRGRGLGLMRAFMESVEIVPSSDGTSVRLERTISRGVTSQR